jgi:hypothetical protein
MNGQRVPIAEGKACAALVRDFRVGVARRRSAAVSVYPAHRLALSNSLCSGHAFAPFHFGSGQSQSPSLGRVRWCSNGKHTRHYTEVRDGCGDATEENRIELLKAVAVRRSNE